MIYPLTGYKLTLPCNTKGELSGKAAEIKDLTGYSSEWFTVFNGRYHFQCPDGGATTDNAKYARSELRDLKNYSCKDKCTDTVKFIVNQLPDNTGVVVHQLHGGGSPWVKIVYTRKGDFGRLRALVKPKDGGKDTEIVLLENIVKGTVIESLIGYTPAGLLTNAKLRVQVNGKSKTITMHRKDKAAFFKRGAYFQSNAKTGKVCEVIHL